ncbi:MAG: flagellar motor switch protein FliG [Longimicrobiales bacterium]
MTQLATRKAGIESLTGRQKAAIVLMAMGAEPAAAVTKGLTPAELEEITYEIARTHQVSADVLAAVVEEWGQLETALHSIAEGGVEYARQILEQTIGPQKAAAMLKRIEGQLRESAGFYNLRNADPAQVTGLVRNEHPQTVALLLAHLEPDQTASVLKELPTKLGGEVLYRLAKMEKVLPEVLQVLERCYGAESTVSISRDLTEAGGLEAVANVLNLMTGSVEKELLEHLAWQDQELCEAIKNLMFVFEDILSLDDRAVQRLLRDVQTKELALALKAASEPLKTRIFSLLSQRAADALREEIEFLGPVRLRDVEQAQATVVKLVRALEESGEIVIGGGEDDLVL